MTQVSWKRQLILAISLFALGMFAYWLEYKHKPETEQKEEQTKKLFEIKDASVESITVTSGDKSFTFTCEDFSAKLCKPGDNSKWDVTTLSASGGTAPAKLRGDDSNVNSFLSSLNSTESSDSIDLKDETPEKRAALLKDYGLDPAARNAPGARKIDVKSSKGETIAYFGGTHPIGDGIFTALETVPAGGKPTGKIDETRVLLTPSYFKNNLDHDLTYWRDKKILNIHDSAIASFKLDSAKAGKLSGERKNGEWMLTSGKEDYPGDTETIDSLLNGVSFLNAKDFTSEDKSDEKARARLKGTKPVLTLVIQQEAPKPEPSAKPGESAAAPAPITVSFLAKNDGPKPTLKKGMKPAAPAISELYVTVSDKAPLYQVDVYAKDRFEKGLKDLRMSKLLSSLERFMVKRIELRGQPVGEPPIVLTSADGKWLQGKKEVDTSKVQSLLDKLSTSKIRDFVEAKAIPTGQDKGLQVSLGDEKTPDKKQLVFWKTGAKVYARDLASPRKEAYEMELPVADTMPFDPAKAQTFFDKSANPAPPPKTPPMPHTLNGMPPGMLKGMPPGMPPGMMRHMPPGHPPVGGPPPSQPSQ